MKVDGEGAHSISSAIKIAVDASVSSSAFTGGVGCLCHRVDIGQSFLDPCVNGYTRWGSMCRERRCGL